MGCMVWSRTTQQLFPMVKRPKGCKWTVLAVLDMAKPATSHCLVLIDIHLGPDRTSLETCGSVRTVRRSIGGVFQRQTANK